MTFPEAVRTAILERYADFQGRSARSEYWWFVLFMVLLNFALGILSQILGSFGDLIGALVGLALLIPGIALTIRRFHDIDMSGWFTLLLLIPIVNIILILIWFTRAGTAGDNRFGADPLGGEAAPAD